MCNVILPKQWACPLPIIDPVFATATNQSTNQSINQSITQSIKESINKAIKCFTHLPVQ